MIFFAGDGVKEIFLVSGNLHKFSEMSKILKQHGIKLKLKKGLKIIEPDADSLEESAEFKAKQAFEQLKKPLIVEDTGVYFSAFKDFPGIYPKRMFLSLGFEGLLKLLEGKKRTGYFKTVVCFIDSKQSKTFSGKVFGRFDERVHNLKKNVLPYEKIFIPKGYKVTMSDIPRNEKNTFSHRFQATKKFAEWFQRF